MNARLQDVAQTKLLSALPALDQLKALAFELKHAHVFHAWLELPIEVQDSALMDKYINISVCENVGSHLSKLLLVNSSSAHQFATQFCEQMHKLNDTIRNSGGSFTLQWFEALDSLSRGYDSTHMLSQAQQVLQLAHETGVYKFPAVAQSIAVTQAHLNMILGNLKHAEEVALKYIYKPYLMPSRANRAHMYNRLLPILAKTGHLAEYREALWRGLTIFYTDHHLREQFAQKARTLYRGTLRTLLQSEVPLSGRLIFLMQRMTAFTGSVPFLKWTGAHKLMIYALITQLYIRNYLTYKRPYLLKTGKKWQFSIGWGKPKAGKILVTRAMGGMGDVMMMAPGLIALKKKYPQKTIHFAIPKSFFSLFEGIDEFTCIDIENTELNTSEYFRWVDLTDCPAARVEGLQFPRVRSNRIAIFAAAMGVKLGRLKTSGILPKYVVSEPERIQAQAYVRSVNPLGLPVIAVQPFSAETYRTWPHAEALVKDLAKTSLVLVFNHEALPGFEGANIHKIIMPVRKSFAIVAQCSMIVAPDSSFVHLGPGLGIPTVGIFGPTNGRVVAKYSAKYIKLVSPRVKGFNCSPCYRNENRACAITGDRESVCLRELTVEDVKAAIAQPMPKAWQRFKSLLGDMVW